MKWPRVLARETLAGCPCLTLAVDPGLVWFAGHFPDQPILPGVAQVAWAITFARESFGFAADPPRMDRIKFLRPIVPGTVVTLELRRTGTTGRVQYRLTLGGHTLGSGRLEFGVPGNN